MPKKPIAEVEAKEAKHGEKMIEIKVRFWTDEISPEKGKILPKHAWSAGVVRMDRNPSHGIAPEQPIPFNSLLELPWIMEEVLLNHGVTLHLSLHSKRYMR